MHARQVACGPECLFPDREMAGPPAVVRSTCSVQSSGLSWPRRRRPSPRVGAARVAQQRGSGRTNATVLDVQTQHMQCGPDHLPEGCADGGGGDPPRPAGVRAGEGSICLRVLLVLALLMSTPRGGWVYEGSRGAATGGSGAALGSGTVLRSGGLRGVRICPAGGELPGCELVGPARDSTSGWVRPGGWGSSSSSNPSRRGRPHRHAALATEVWRREFLLP